MSGINLNERMTFDSAQEISMLADLLVMELTSEEIKELTGSETHINSNSGEESKTHITPGGGEEVVVKISTNDGPRFLVASMDEALLFAADETASDVKEYGEAEYYWNEEDEEDEE